MLVAGVDVGAATAKTAIVLDGKVISWAVMPTGDYVENSAMEVTITALAQAGYTMDDLDYCCSTGYGRRVVKFSQKAISEIICHAKGVNYYFPDVRTIIDIGGQDSKVISVLENGTVADFVMNDKCAAGTGRFLEVMADVMRITINDMGPEAIKSKHPAQINSTCTIFAESEMVSLRAQKTPREDMIAGIHKAVSRRVGILGRQVGYKERIAFTGGVALNTGVIHFLQAFLKTTLVIPEPPQIMGAIGAALLYSTKVGTTDFGQDEKVVEDVYSSCGSC